MGNAVRQTVPVWTNPDDLTQRAPIFVLAPHPDDESLGCGALLAHAFAHDGAHVVCMTDGSASHPGSHDWPPERLAQKRQCELSLALKCLGGSTDDLTWFGYPDGWLGTEDREKIAETLAVLVRRLGVKSLFAPAPEDYHEDHKTTADIARRVVRASPGLTLYDYPVWSRWDDPDFASHIAQRRPLYLDPFPGHSAKRAAVMAHCSQIGGLILDAPDGFTLPAGFIDSFIDAPEVYVRAAS